MINNCKKCEKIFLSSKFVRRRGIPGELIRQAQELDLIHRSHIKKWQLID